LKVKRLKIDPDQGRACLPAGRGSIPFIGSLSLKNESMER